MSNFNHYDTWSAIEGNPTRLAIFRDWVNAAPGRNLLYGVSPFPKGINGSLASCAAGQYDSHYVTLANNLINYGLRSAYLRLGWEMDGDWYIWGAGKSLSSRAPAFAGCFRRMVQVMRQAQPTNQFKFVWNPTTDSWPDSSWLEAAWPGDSYVDVIGLDLYDQNWAANTYPYPSTCDAACRLTRQQNSWNFFAGRLNTVRSFAAAHGGKPLAFPEWGVVIHQHGHGGGDDPYYIQKMHEFITNPANKVVFHAYFNIRASFLDTSLTEPGDSELKDPPYTRFPNSAALFKKLFGPESY